MRDVVRYTAISKPNNIVSEYDTIMTNLSNKGYNVSAVYSTRWWELQEQMLKEAETLEIPKNIERIGKHGG
ncbi:hypothetical protein OfM2_20290 [Lactovum odontotermitis]